jgi:hypothetical protein
LLKRKTGMEVYGYYKNFNYKNIGTQIPALFILEMKGEELYAEKR